MIKTCDYQLMYGLFLITILTLDITHTITVRYIECREIYRIPLSSLPNQDFIQFINEEVICSQLSDAAV